VTTDDKLISLLRRLTKTNKDDHSAKKVRNISAGSTLHYNQWCSVYTYTLEHIWSCGISHWHRLCSWPIGD